MKFIDALLTLVLLAVSSLPQSAYCMGKSPAHFNNTYTLQSLSIPSDEENGQQYCAICGLFGSLQSKMSNSDIAFIYDYKEHGENWLSCGSVTDVCSVNSYTINVNAILLKPDATKVTTDKILYQDLSIAGFSGIQAKDYLCDIASSWLSKLSTNQVIVIPTCLDDGISATLLIAQQK